MLIVYEHTTDETPIYVITPDQETQLRDELGIPVLVSDDDEWRREEVPGNVVEVGVTLRASAS